MGFTRRYYITMESGEEERQGNRKLRERVGFSSAFLFPPRKWEAVTKGGTRETDNPM